MMSARPPASAGGALGGRTISASVQNRVQSRPLPIFEDVIDEAWHGMADTSCSVCAAAWFCTKPSKPKVVET
jgi:hypothetical protein